MSAATPPDPASAAAAPTPPPGWNAVLDSAKKGELVAIIGSGVSISLTTGSKNKAPSWTGLVAHGLDHAQTKGLITDKQAQSWTANQLESTDLDDLLSAAEFVGRKLEAPLGDHYQRWLESVFTPLTVANDAMRAAILSLHRARVPLVTLNYDHLLEEVTGLPPVNLERPPTAATDWVRRPLSGVLHLHGSYARPSTCILGIRDYEQTTKDAVRQFVQTNLAAVKRLLFIGCGDTFADPNFTTLIAWLHQHMQGSTLQHYALVDQDDHARRQADKTWHHFADPIPYGTGHAALPEFLMREFGPLAADLTKRLAKDPAPPVPALSATHAELVERYKKFLIKDCGQMTLEGMRTDYELGRQRFDIEKLFVALDVIPSLPDFGPDESDTQREYLQPYQQLLQALGRENLGWSGKLALWVRNRIASDSSARAEPTSLDKPVNLDDPITFGRIFEKSPHLALLALPGGGKTMLLKRLAVAYADPARRLQSADGLPPLQLTPVLIRCREWRDHIHLPLPTLLKRLPDITGQPELKGVHEALMPLFKAGKILLLVDGLDEIHDDGNRTALAANLESFIREHPGNRLVLTSREAGFALIAPTLSRFCMRWRIAPLRQDAIRQFCHHWRILMGDDSPDTLTDMEAMLALFDSTPALQRLTENPLLLTMLLVVRHGAGRLPPDRVSLYNRASEVLLDTWNIRGHPPLTPKEYIPYLACVAYEMMKNRQQTISETDLLILLEQARQSVNHGRSYSQDSAAIFLKRVELRSSLLVQAGHQMEHGRYIPFYQFRHLTFQEYLAAVAAAEGHYLGYSSEHNILTPLAPYLFAEEWKEVVPMAAVLAKKAAEPLLVELLKDSRLIDPTLENLKGIQALLAEDPKEDNSKPTSAKKAASTSAQLPLIIQCLIEEADASPATLDRILEALAKWTQLFAYPEAWKPLARGAYGHSLFEHYLRRYHAENTQPSLDHLCSVAAWLLSRDRRTNNEWLSWLERQLTSTNADEIIIGLILALLLIKGTADREHPLPHALSVFTTGASYQETMTRMMSLWEHSDCLIASLAIDTWRAYFETDSTVQLRASGPRSEGISLGPTFQILTTLAHLSLKSFDLSVRQSCAGLLLAHASNLQLNDWKIHLEPEEISSLRDVAKGGFGFMVTMANLTIAAHSGQVWSSEEIRKQIPGMGPPPLEVEDITDADRQHAEWIRQLRDKLPSDFVSTPPHTDSSPYMAHMDSDFDSRWIKPVP